jgi:hypothetical protein
MNVRGISAGTRRTSSAGRCRYCQLQPKADQLSASGIDQFRSFGVGGFGVDPAEVSVHQSVGVAFEGTSTVPATASKTSSPSSLS